MIARRLAKLRRGLCVDAEARLIAHVNDASINVLKTAQAASVSCATSALSCTVSARERPGISCRRALWASSVQLEPSWKASRYLSASPSARRNLIASSQHGLLASALSVKPRSLQLPSLSRSRDSQAIRSDISLVLVVTLHPQELHTSRPLVPLFTTLLFCDIQPVTLLEQRQNLLYQVSVLDGLLARRHPAVGAPLLEPLRHAADGVATVAVDYD